MTRDLSTSPAKVVLITGGTKGIGAGIAKAYLAQGDTVIVCARTAPQAPIQVGDAKAHFISVDLKSLDDIERLFMDIEEGFGRLDVVINNAGGSPAVDAAEVSPRFHESILKLNLIAPLNVAQQANRLMQKQNSGGCIVFIGSISALRPSPGTAAYGAAKAGVLSLVQSLAVEWAPKVRVVAVSPGLIKTELSHLHYGDESGIARVEQTIPLQRMGLPEDVANACLYVSSEQASYVSGSNLVIHGGGEKPAFLSSND
ncbi:SDR family oxidoreductase [Thalassotalea ponticola]|uniref:SDR family oxidoreductase n=1 Tax=Thalassotalea ponticola TaxID=1523392 RepID=UPI0025B5060F|nr:SDR family oxidoreductase [Thalassotalea ponticola]MDN3653448.1 SDR family oxidoreductase [Thalassotalea ponticola]